MQELPSPAPTIAFARLVDTARNERVATPSGAPTACAGGAAPAPPSISDILAAVNLYGVVASIDSLESYTVTTAARKRAQRQGD
jgi:hypothetical protein